MVNNLNRSLKGYQVTLGNLDFHPMGFALTLKDLHVLSQAPPHSAVAVIPFIALRPPLRWTSLAGMGRDKNREETIWQGAGSRTKLTKKIEQQKIE